MMTPAGSFFPHPEGMSEDAAELWRHIVDAHPRGYFQAGDVPLLRAYCEEYARRNRAERMLAEQGEVIRADGEVMPGLFVGGEASCNSAYMGFTLSNCFTWGRIGAQSAAAYLKA